RAFTSTPARTTTAWSTRSRPSHAATFRSSTTASTAGRSQRRRASAWCTLVRNGKGAAMENKPIARRDFVKTSALGAGAALGALYVPRRAFGANDRISLGLVGPGGRAQELIKWVYEIEGSHNVEFTAVCDIWNQRREAAAQKFKEHYNRDVRKCRTVSEIVALKDV